MNYDDELKKLLKKLKNIGDDLSLNDIENAISSFSVDNLDGNNIVPFLDNMDTVLYSGGVYGGKSSSIIKEIDNVRIIDNSATGKLLEEANSNGLREMIEMAIENDISKGNFNPSDFEASFRSASEFDAFKNDFISYKAGAYDDFLGKASSAFLYEPKDGAWAIASEHFVKSTPGESHIYCITPEADLNRT